MPALKPMNKRKSIGILLKSECQKTILILNKILKHIEAGTVDEGTKKTSLDTTLFLRIFILKNQMKEESVAFKHNRSLDKIERKEQSLRGFKRQATGVTDQL